MPKIQNQAIWSKIVVFEFMSVEKLTWLQSSVQIVKLSCWEKYLSKPQFLEFRKKPQLFELMHPHPNRMNTILGMRTV